MDTATLDTSIVNASATPRGVVAIVANRRLDNVQSGSTAYLRTFFEEVERNGLEPRLAVAPLIGFGNRPWAKVHPAFQGGAVIWPKTVKFGETYISLSPLVWGRFALRVAQEALMRLGAKIRIKSQLSDVPKGWERQALCDAIRALGADAVAVEYSSLGPLLGDLTDIPARYVILHDLFSKRAALFRSKGETPDHADITLEEEAAMCAGATGIVYISLAERETFSPLLPGLQHMWLKPSFRVRRDALKDREKPFALFVGADHAGNRDALGHFLNDVWPLVLAKEPGAKLVVAGAIGKFVPPETPGDVEIMGRVDDLATLAGPDVIGLAPIRLGSGTPIKVADYMGLGMPVATYASGVVGFGETLGQAIMRANSTEEYAEHVAALLQSRELRVQMSEAALRCSQALRDEPGLDEEFSCIGKR